MRIAITALQRIFNNGSACQTNLASRKVMSVENRTLVVRFTWNPGFALEEQVPRWRE